MKNDIIPLVSICCITYNHEKYIQKCLDGFFMQKTNFPFEILIHDDASTDNTQQIIKDYQRKYPHVIKPIFQHENQYSKGVKILFSYLYTKVRGKYIALCEGDDCWIDPLKLQKQIDFLEGHPDYGLIHTQCQVTNLKTGKISTEIRNCIDGQPINELLLGVFYIATLTVCFRTILLTQIDKSYLKENFLMGDYPMWLEIVRICKIKYINDVTSNYNIREGSLSHKVDKKENLIFYINVRDIRLYFIKKYNYMSVYNKIYKEKTYYMSLYYALDNKIIKSIFFLLRSKHYSILNIFTFLKHIYYK